VATISRLLKITGLFCKRALSKRRYSPKEIYNFKEPTNRSHPIVVILVDTCIRTDIVVLLVDIHVYAQRVYVIYI